jgi:PKD repeat protein
LKTNSKLKKIYRVMLVITVFMFKFIMKNQKIMKELIPIKKSIAASIKVILAFLFLQTNVYAQAPCPNCPQVIGLFDTSKCQNGVTLEASTGYTNVIPQQVNNPLKVCQNSLMKYKVVDFTGCSYDIQPTNVTVTGGTLVNTFQNTFTIQWGSGLNGKVSFKIKSGNIIYNCDTFAHVFFTLIPNPIASFTANPQPACFNSPTHITFNSNASQNAVSYFWDFGDGFTSLGANPVHAYNAPGSYQVCLTVSNYEAGSPSGSIGPPCVTCFDSICKTIVIDTLPAPPITCVATVCAGATATYTTAASGCSSYNWIVVGGTITNGQGTNTIQVTWGNGNPQGSISLVVAGCSNNYCAQGNTVNVPIVSNSLNIVGDTLVCINSSSNYSLPTLPATNYSWSVNSPANIIPVNTNTSSVDVTFTSLGTYTLNASYYDSTLQCGGSAAIVIFVRPYLQIKGQDKTCQNNSSILQSYFLNPSNIQIPQACNWSILPSGATITSGNGTPTATINWPSAGTYTVTATSTSSSPSVCNISSYTVLVNPKPIVTAINGLNNVCPGGTSVYSALANTSGQFSWFITGGSGIQLNGNADSVQITWNNAGPYSIGVTLTAFGTNCVSDTLVKNVSPFPTPILTGNTSVCVDDTLNYSVAFASPGNYNWFITPPNLGTILSGQGTSSVQIKWHGDNTNTNPISAYLYFGACHADSILITINKPPSISVITSGTLCSSGINLSTNATSGIYNWSSITQLLTPSQPTNLNSLTGLQLPGNYAVNISNVNGSGCNVMVNYQIPDIGRPDAQIYTTGSTYYCLPNLPSMTINALTGAGYTYQWFLNGNPIGSGVDTLQVNSSLINTAGNYNFYCVVTVGLCKDTSSNIIIQVNNCVPSPGCLGTFDITSISNCNPFTLGLTATFPSGATLSNFTITHYDENSVVNGLTTKSYTSIGLKQFKVCALVSGPGANCIYCKDSFATVSLAALFTLNNNCGIVTLTDQSTVIPPATISSYTWTVTDGANNIVLPSVASFNNTAIPSPILSITQNGTFIITQTVTASNGCASIYKDTINVVLADASFNVGIGCASTPLNMTGAQSGVIHFWDFGDASVSYVYPTAHAYSSPGTYTIQHIVTNNLGCTDTLNQTTTIWPNPFCNIVSVGNNPLCSGDTLFLNACTGYSSYQWYKNGIAISSSNVVVFPATQTGNYSFQALDINGCVVTSDTINLLVIPKPSTTFLQSGPLCDGANFTISIPSCTGCFYNWFVDNNPIIIPGNSNVISGFGGLAPYTVGSHWITVNVLSGGCLITDSTQITFNAEPSVSVTTVGPLPKCSNNPYIFSATSNASSPTWAWNLGSQTLSTTNILNTSSNGIYTVIVTDGVTGCTNQAVEFINESPDLSLFPIGCDLICDTAFTSIPLPSLNGDLSIYSSINWYKFPNLSNIIASGNPFPVNTLANGNHQLAVIVTSVNGCVDTSTVYSITTYSCNIPLENLALRITAFEEANFNKIMWHISDEKQILNYEVLKSKDGYTFSSLGNQMALHHNEASSYFMLDKLPFEPFTYYKIRVTDMDNKYFDSEIAVVKRNSETSGFQVFPNPSKDQIFITKKANMELFDLTGKLLLKSIQTSEMAISHLANGVYYLKCIDENKKQFVFKIIKN